MSLHDFSLRNVELHAALKSAVWEQGRVAFRKMAELATPKEWADYATANVVEPKHNFRRAAFAHIPDTWLGELNEDPAATVRLLQRGLNHRDKNIVDAALEGMQLAILPPFQPHQPLRHLVSTGDRMGAGVLKSALMQKHDDYPNMGAQLKYMTDQLQATINDYDHPPAPLPPLRPAVNVAHEKPQQLRLL